MNPRYPSAPSITPETLVKLPLRVWLAVIAAVIGAATGVCGMYFSIKHDVENHASDIQDLKKSDREMREILIRVDENLKEVKRRIQ